MPYFIFLDSMNLAARSRIKAEQFNERSGNDYVVQPDTEMNFSGSKIWIFNQNF